MSQEKKIREKKKPTLLHAVIPLLGLLVCLGGGYAYLKLPTQSACLQPPLWRPSWRGVSA